MRNALLFALLLAVVGCGNGSEPTPPNGSGKGKPDPKLGQEARLTPIEGLSRYALGDPIHEGNVTIVPVMLASNNDQAQIAEYMTLEEAKKLGVVEISELTGREEVNRLLVKNSGTKPLLLLAGELLLGGKQDRVVAKDTIVPPSEAVEVPVFCVEHGRWEGTSSKFEYSTSMVPQKVRRRALTGTQQEVWDGVAEYNAEAGVDVNAGTSIRGGFSTQEVQKRVNADTSKFTAALDKMQNVVGLVYVVNGNIESFELFGNTVLLNNSREALLKGFLADAAVQKTKTVKEFDMNAVQAFIKESLSGSRNQTRLTGDGANWNVNGTNSAGAEMTLPSAQMGKDGEMDHKQIVHGSYTPKN